MDKLISERQKVEMFKSHKSRFARPLIIGFVLFAGCLLIAPFSQGAEQSAAPRTSWSQTVPPAKENNPQEDILAAEKRFEEAQKEFNHGNAAASAQTQPRVQTPRQTPKRSSAVQRRADSNIQVYNGSPETGYAGTWTDPVTGDTVTSVIAPTPRTTTSQMQNYPIIIEPQVSGAGWYGYDSSGSQQDWPQWPGHPGDNGYPPSPAPAPAPSFPPSNQPGPAYGPFPGYVPNNPVPPFSPGYRPLRPGSAAWPGNGGLPPQPPSNNPGWPPSYQPAPPNAWQPNSPGTPGWVPPSYQPAPPNAWQPNKPPSGWRPGGGFRPVRPIMVPGANPQPR